MPYMSTTIYGVLDELRAQSTSESDKGTKFERLIAEYMRTDPMYAEQFSDVYLWQDWPGRGGKHDTGIDIVAVDRLTGSNVAAQCKFFDPHSTVSKPDIDSFLSTSRPPPSTGTRSTGPRPTSSRSRPRRRCSGRTRSRPSPTSPKAS